MKDNSKFSKGPPEYTIQASSKEFIVSRCIDEKQDDILYGLRTYSNWKAFLGYCRAQLYFTPRRQHHHREEFFVSDKDMEQKWSKISHHSLQKAKKIFKEKRLIEFSIHRLYSGHTCTHFLVTESGWALYHRIQADQQKNIEQNEDQTEDTVEEKKPVYKFTEKDEEIAKYWYAQLRKFWHFQKGVLRSLETWQEQREVRADTVRRVRERLELGEDASDLLEAMKIVAQDPKESEFFFKNVRGKNALLNKWKSGDIAAQSIILRSEELIKSKQEESLKGIDIDDDFPDYPNEEKFGDDVWKIWLSAFDILDGRMRTQYKTSEDREKAKNVLLDLCEELADRLNYNLTNIPLKSSKLANKMREDEDGKSAAYWYFVLDFYRDWNGTITMQMLWKCWIEFWKKIWRVNHGDPTDADMEQFFVAKYTEI